MTWTPTIGQRVRANISMVNDLTEEGLGVQHCCRVGDELIVRSLGSGYRNFIHVSHEDVPESAFCCAPDEIAPIPE